MLLTKMVKYEKIRKARLEKEQMKYYFEREEDVTLPFRHPGCHFVDDDLGLEWLRLYQPIPESSELNPFFELNLPDINKYTMKSVIGYDLWRLFLRDFCELFTSLHNKDGYASYYASLYLQKHQAVIPGKIIIDILHHIFTVRQI